jgi:hypothetical protein
MTDRDTPPPGRRIMLTDQPKHFGRFRCPLTPDHADVPLKTTNALGVGGLSPRSNMGADRRSRDKKTPQGEGGVSPL